MFLPKRDYPLWKRAVAGSIDFAVVFLALKLKFFWLSIAAYIYIIFRDYINEGQSLGKEIMGLRTIHLDGVSKVSIRQSIMRNLHYLIFALSWRVPYAPLVITPLFMAIAAFEYYCIYVIPYAPRLMGIWAQTTVTEDRYIDDILE